MGRHENERIIVAIWELGKVSRSVRWLTGLPARAYLDRIGCMQSSFGNNAACRQSSLVQQLLFIGWLQPAPTTQQTAEQRYC